MSADSKDKTDKGSATQTSNGEWAVGFYVEDEQENIFHIEHRNVTLSTALKTVQDAIPVLKTKKGYTVVSPLKDNGRKDPRKAKAGDTFTFKVISIQKKLTENGVEHVIVKNVYYKKNGVRCWEEVYAESCVGDDIAKLEPGETLDINKRELPNRLMCTVYYAPSKRSEDNGKIVPRKVIALFKADE